MNTTFYTLLLGCFWVSLPSLFATANSVKVEQLTEQARTEARAKNYSSAIATNEQLLVALETLHQTREHPTIAATHSRIAGYYYNMGRYKKAATADSSALVLRECIFGTEAYETGSSYNNLAVDFRRLGLYSKALKVQLLALKTRILHKGATHLKTARCYENLAITYGYLHDYGRALQYYDEALAIYKKQLTPDDPEMAGLYNNRAIVKYRMKKFEAALDDYLQAATIHLQQPTLDQARFAQASYNVSNAYIELDCLSDALFYLNQSIRIYNKLSLNYHLGLGHCYENLARVYMKQKKWRTAAEHAQRALAIHSWEESFNALEVAGVYKTLGIIALEENDLATAHTYLDSAAAVVQQHFTAGESDQSADLLKLELESDFAAIYLQQYENSGQIADLRKSLAYSLTSIENYEKYRSFNSSEAAKIVNHERVLPIYERAIKAAYLLHARQPRSHYLVVIFQLIEGSKSVVLQTALRKVRTDLALALPPEITQQEEAFQTKISQLEKRRYELKNEETTDSATLDTLQQQIFRVQQEFHAWLDDLEQHYPKYFELKYQTVTTDFASIQEQLTTDQTLVEYFVGQDDTYALLVQKDTVHLRQWHHRQPLAALCQDFQQNIYQYQPSAKVNSKYATAAYALYQQLVQPIQSLLTRRVVIVADKQMGYIPFAALIDQLPTDWANYRSYNYLVRQHQFSYGYSAAFWVDGLKHDNRLAEENLLAFAPSFSSQQPIALNTGQRDNLNVLKYNIEESEVVKKHWGGKVFSGQQATKKRFLQEATKYNFLHLATHGQANNKNGDYANLAFTNQTAERDYLLYLREIYDLNFNTKMLVLSACETGVGPLRKGDGIISLARGFTYAGVQSIVTTLWKINDRTSVKIMDAFYEQLLKHHTKDAALQRAQLQYLNQQPLQLTHPFYWAAYIPIGNMETVQPVVSNYRIFFLGFALIAIFGLLSKYHSALVTYLYKRFNNVNLR